MATKVEAFFGIQPPSYYYFILGVFLSVMEQGNERQRNLQHNETLVSQYFTETQTLCSCSCSTITVSSVDDRVDV